MGGIVLLVGAIYAFDFKLNHWRLQLLDAIIHLVIGPAFLMSFGFGFSFSFIAVLFGLHAAALGILCGITAIRAGKSERASRILGLAATVSLLAGAYMIIGRSWAPDRLLLTASLYMVIFGLLLLLLCIVLRTTHHPKLA
jgi:predicted membrane metal-binding protein